ncbi:hypothetical protein SELMODRAFT_404561 [Selaginella moellendorffii]|uniref:Uncharacterized protein n=1 Tax=Selaginella moellendorffii TaxID=88036 RepID=D8QVQ7_SELML|nr:hypothetical protein SELMODRAFT_404561 [Selaginella moellendorffii]
MAQHRHIQQVFFAVRDERKSSFAKKKIAISAHSFVCKVLDPRATHECWAYKLGSKNAIVLAMVESLEGRQEDAARENSGVDGVMIVVTSGLQWVARSKLVCKHWARMLDDPSFRNEPVIKELPDSWESRFAPEASVPYLSHGGLVLCDRRKIFVNKKHFLVGNPLTQQWVQVHPIDSFFDNCTQALATYVSDGKQFFRISLSPYVFDSRLGIRTLPRYQTVCLTSLNTVFISTISVTSRTTPHLCCSRSKMWRSLADPNGV